MHRVSGSNENFPMPGEIPFDELAARTAYLEEFDRKVMAAQKTPNRFYLPSLYNPKRTED
jgi:hypothetical protein